MPSKSSGELRKFGLIYIFIGIPLSLIYIGNLLILYGIFLFIQAYNIDRKTQYYRSKGKEVEIDYVKKMGLIMPILSIQPRKMTHSQKGKQEEYTTNITLVKKSKQCNKCGTTNDQFNSFCKECGDSFYA
ncbi:MAG: hypothetical protein INQ03_10320 [Candidatus Heimdallarchaeota archaeon]|nr:hypothetical protein [Candidatus Heimdallarchaeota archaeon]